MQVRQIVQALITQPAARREVWLYATDRGLGQGMQIERWLLIEMAVRLMELQRQGVITRAEGEHKFPRAKTRIFEHCDLWWTQEGVEHWLEAKTIVVGGKKSLGTSADIAKDLTKREQLHTTDLFHHLAIIFPLDSQSVQTWRTTFDPVFAHANMNFGAHWAFELWDEKQLNFFLYSAR